jgi:LPS-assembly lipoprotein
MFRLAVGLCLALVLSSCQFQPLYGDQQTVGNSGSQLSAVKVSQVDSRVGQQVRNHLLFLLNGGFGNSEKSHEARIRVTWSNRQLAAIQGVRDNVSGL